MSRKEIIDLTMDDDDDEYEYEQNLLKVKQESLETLRHDPVRLMSSGEVVDLTQSPLACSSSQPPPEPTHLIAHYHSPQKKARRESDIPESPKLSASSHHFFFNGCKLQEPSRTTNTGFFSTTDMSNNSGQDIYATNAQTFSPLSKLPIPTAPSDPVKIIVNETQRDIVQVNAHSEALDVVEMNPSSELLTDAAPVIPCTTQIEIAVTDIHRVVSATAECLRSTLNSLTETVESAIDVKLPIQSGDLSNRNSLFEEKKKCIDDPKLEGMIKHLRDMLFPPALLEVEPTELCNTDIIIHLMQTALRSNPNSPGMNKLIELAIREQNSQVYLMLAETKAFLLRRMVDDDKMVAGFKPLGLGDRRLVNMLRALFFEGAEAHFQGEPLGKSRDNGESTCSNNAKKEKRGVSNVKSKSVERQTAMKNINEVLTTGSVEGKFGAGKVRTIEDAKFVVAQQESIRNTQGRRILETWRSYLECIAASGAFSLYQCVMSQAEALVDFCLDLEKLAQDLRDGKKVPMGLDNKPLSKTVVKETLAEKNARVAAILLTEVCAEIHKLLYQARAIIGFEVDLPKYEDELIKKVLADKLPILDQSPLLDDKSSKGVLESEPNVRTVTSTLDSAVSLGGSLLSQWQAPGMSINSSWYIIRKFQILSDRVVQCLGIPFHTDGSIVMIESCGETATLRSLSGKLCKVVRDLVVKIQLTQVMGFNTSVSAGERQILSVEVLRDLVEELRAKYPTSATYKKTNREGKLIDIIDGMAAKCVLQG